MKSLLSTKEVAALLKVNEKMVYSLVADKGLPASKVTGKWLFPKHLVEQWVENNTLNFPNIVSPRSSYNDLLIVAGSNDILLEKTLSLFNRLSDTLAVFANVGSMGGLHALRNNSCHIAACHLMQEDGKEYNFEIARKELEADPVVVNLCRRHQGLLVTKGNPKNIIKIEDLNKKKVAIVNRHLGTGTRLLLDNELKKAGIEPVEIQGYDKEVNKHRDVGLEDLAGRADTGLGIEAVASLLDLDFIPLCWERFDLVISKALFFEKPVQSFLSILHEKEFRQLAQETPGYDLNISGKVVFQGSEINKG